MKVSIVLPVYNEARGLPEVAQRIREVFEQQDYDYEIIFVNDGSRDESGAVLNQLAKDNPKIKIIHFTRNFGQTPALAAGIDHATGEIIVPMDSDLENHPEDIPKMIEKMNEGYDIVSGWRRDRWQGQAFTRRIPSDAASWLISAISGLKLHDHGSTLKAYRGDMLKGIRLYGDMHRFMAAYLSWQGARVAEIPINYSPRKYGKSNYGLNRVFKVILDLVTLRFLTRFFHKPMHFFGGVGLISIFLGLVAAVFAIYFKFSTVNQKDFISTPLPVIMALFFIVGVLFILMGLLAEILVRTYHESQDKKTSEVKEKINF